jgi:predicted  nucleic acid-binding Zn-ribbon protein
MTQDEFDKVLRLKETEIKNLRRDIDQKNTMIADLEDVVVRLEEEVEELRDELDELGGTA